MATTKPKTKHTPGPWISPEALPDKFVWGTKNNTNIVIAKVNAQESRDPKVTISEKEAFANAKLIAAAPELLEILKNITQTLKAGCQSKKDKNEMEGSPIFQAAIAAIKKATE